MLPLRGTVYQPVLRRFVKEMRTITSKRHRLLWTRRVLVVRKAPYKATRSRSNQTNSKHWVPVELERSNRSAIFQTAITYTSIAGWRRREYKRNLLRPYMRRAPIIVNDFDGTVTGANTIPRRQ
jgi:hypothetical protein